MPKLEFGAWTAEVSTDPRELDKHAGTITGPLNLLMVNGPKGVDYCELRSSCCAAAVVVSSVQYICGSCRVATGWPMDKPFRRIYSLAERSVLGAAQEWLCFLDPLHATLYAHDLNELLSLWAEMRRVESA